ncbi:SH3 domain-containing protein [Enhygromyxa salina]|uniref:Bacterial SH3 domain protein n=1 Tax=Enhygromyxa salina TaxID=215803 RepID=A0A2S9XTX3_9BACT|nr:SH3 domain-containing protein [Enhygromyxa salina]PRP96293.1 Bacterial SH3 domain protein [Enhygromyxa salina]
MSAEVYGCGQAVGRQRGCGRGRGVARGLALALALGLGWSSQARADVVDDAYAAGSEAAAANDWAGAIEHWQRALELLPGRSAQLDYDLGTAYAQLGELGRATYHFERALQPEARPSVEVAEAARRNRGIVRRQAEVQAEVNDARISRPPTWWDLVVGVLAGQALAWISLISAWLLVGTVAVRRWRARMGTAGESRGIGRALVLVFALAFGLGGGLHALAITADADHPDAVVLDTVVEVREGPGAHLPVAFTMQGGSRVRVLDQRSGWLRVRLPGGLEGWVAVDSIARLYQPPKRARTNASGAAPAAKPI